MRLLSRYAEPVNIALILLGCGLAHVFPYHLLLFSYAVLGPAHYLTQISWLHDRRYFATSRLLLPVMASFSLLLVALALIFGGAAALVPMALVLNAAVWLAVFVTLPAEKPLWRALAAAAGVVSAGLVVLSPLLVAVLVLLLPSVFHVFVFTAGFMLAGALKTRKPGAWAALVALLLSAGTFLFPAAGFVAGHDLDGIAFFQPIVDFLQRLGLSGATDAQLFGFLSFAYTYHYLNWFSKAEVIRWNDIPRKRMAAIIAVYIIVLSIYAYDYKIGILFVLALSYAHVLLEFPLNLRTFTAIACGRI